jgi:hypothetical protein
MSYGADFANADPANAPLDAPLLIGADSFVWGALLLALLAAGLVGWIIGHYFSRSKVDAAEAIWKAVNDAVKDAMKASTDDLPSRATALRRVIDARLGKTLKFGGELAGAIKDLDTAIKGEIEDKAPSTPAAKAAACAQETGSGSAAAAAAAAATNVTIVSLCPQPAAPVCPAPPAAPAKPEKRPMTTDERNNAFRLAVAKLDDYWRHQKTREADIKAVVAELTNPGPKPTQPVSSPPGGLSGTTTTQ